MGYYTRAQLVTMLATLDTRIGKAEEAQIHDTGEGSITRGYLKSMYDERKWLLERIESIDNASVSTRVSYGRHRRVT